MKKKEVVVVLFTAHGRVSNAAQEQSHPKNHKECERKTKTQKFFYFSPFFKTLNKKNSFEFWRKERKKIAVQEILQIPKTSSYRYTPV